jgi:hypothetical protein
MDPKAIVHVFNYVEPALALLALIVVVRCKQFKNVLPLSLFLILRIVATTVYLLLVPIAHHEKMAHQPVTAYAFFFYFYWISYIIEAGLIFMLIRRLYQMALDPLVGLQYLGMIVFRWLAVVSILIAAFTSITPNATGVQFLVSAATQLQRTQSILVLCLLFFLTMTAKPLAFTYKSRIFGIGTGLGIMACTDLVQSAWLSGNPSINGYYNVIKGGVLLSAILIWGVYYALPEAQRGLVTLPVTSPLLRWNEIGVALGYPETHVVVTAEGRPLFGDAELEAIRLSQRGNDLSAAGTTA